MKKKLIWISTLLTSFTLIVFLMLSILFTAKNNRQNNEKVLGDLVLVLRDNYIHDEYEKSAEIVTRMDNRYRVTIINDSGTVVYDTFPELIEENHLDRPEIQHLGEISYRYSKTLGYKMLYKATYLIEEKLYLRVAIPEAKLKAADHIYILEMSIVTLIILGIDIVIITLSSRKLTEPLKKEIYRLNQLTGDQPPLLDDDILSLSKQIEDVSILIDDKMQLINKEKTRLNDLINNLNAGIIVLQGETIELYNVLAAHLFHLKQAELIGKNYCYAILDYQFSLKIQNVMQNHVEESFVYHDNQNTYRIILTPISNQSETLIFIYDITKEMQLNQMKEDFFANASHELKSPLTTILGYLQMIEEGILIEKDDIEDAHLRITKEAKRMNSIISEMLNLASLEVNQNEKNITELSLFETIQDILTSFQRDIEQKGITVEIEKKEDFKVKMNTMDLYHLISNLVSNAIKYNKQNGKIKITIQKPFFLISDTGIGIPYAEQSRIFERFYRVDKAKSKELGGTGLGLAIVKHIVNNYDLTLELESKENEGTTFKIGWKINEDE